MNSKNGHFDIKENEKSTFSLKNHNGEEKIKMVREAIKKEIPSNGFNSRKGIDVELFNKCTRDFIEMQNGRFVHNVRSEVTLFELNHLKNQNHLLKQLIAELSHENTMLKNRLLSGVKSKASGE